MSETFPVIYSPGYGAGWSTWGDRKSCLDRELATAIEQRDLKEACRIATKNWPGQYQGGLEECVVVWLPQGTLFRIEEYDGNESIKYNHDDFWLTGE